jgi:hypothetical protein
VLCAANKVGFVTQIGSLILNAFVNIISAQNITLSLISGAHSIFKKGKLDIIRKVRAEVLKIKFRFFFFVIMRK